MAFVSASLGSPSCFIALVAKASFATSKTFNSLAWRTGTDSELVKVTQRAPFIWIRGVRCTAAAKQSFVRGTRDFTCFIGLALGHCQRTKE